MERIIIEPGLRRGKFGPVRYNVKVDGQYLCDPAGVMILQYDSKELAKQAAEKHLKQKEGN